MKKLIPWTIAALVITLGGGAQAASDQGRAHRSDQAAERTSTPNHGTETAANHANLDAVPDGSGFLGFSPDIASALPAGWCGCYVEGVYTGNDPYDMIEENCNPSFVPDAQWIYVGTLGVCIVSWDGSPNAESYCAATDTKLRGRTSDNTVCVFSSN